jgi:hypothetical protein
VYALQHVAEALQTPVDFGRQAHLVAENLDEPAATETSLSGHLTDRRRCHGLEPTQGKGHGRVPRQRPGDLRPKRLLDDSESAGYCRSLEQQLAQPATSRSPEDLQGGLPIL